MSEIQNILTQESFTKEDLLRLLTTTDGDERLAIFRRAAEIREEFVGNKVYLRGLIELSNRCTKDCCYCGIRKSNKEAIRYSMNDSSVLEAVRHAWKSGFGSVVLQSGERSDKAFILKISNLLRQIKTSTRNEIGITLSCGEQSEETYREWYELGAHRYLLRIESSTEDLYYTIHPKDKKHDFKQRLKALESLKKAGYQTGTGVMIGLPGQTAEHLANDLLFFKAMDVDMVGMGPYVPHSNTPMFDKRNDILPPHERFELSQRMIALLRILMKDVNIAAATAMDTLNPSGRAITLVSGANVFMPSLMPAELAENYSLYDGKPVCADYADCAIIEMIEKIKPFGLEVAFEEWGDSPHFKKRMLE